MGVSSGVEYVMAFVSPVVYQRRSIVCRRCGCRIRDIEPSSPRGEFYHPSGAGTCKNEGLTFCLDDDNIDRETEPFVRKRVRRAAKRLGVRVREH